jgi:hypothetical protein
LDEHEALRALLTSLETWSRFGLGRPLRPYQLEPARAILESIREERGDVFVVMMARQAGKNELSAHLEAFLLATRQRRVATLVKAAPTFKPQTLNSLLRLQSMLELCPITTGRWRGEHGYIVRLGRARILFFSVAPGASIVGATASVLLEVDEAQDVLIERYDRDLSPMASSTNATRVLYGTVWDSRTLLARQEQAGLEAQARDGRRRVFRYPWYVVAESNPAYGRFVEGERARLGAEHPLFLTQYELRAVDGESGFFTRSMRDQLAGDHPPEAQAGAGVYVAGLDVAGAADEGTDGYLREVAPPRDSTVLLIGRVTWVDVAESAREAAIEVVSAVWWTGHRHRDQFVDLLELLRHRWGVARVCVDATGVGAPLAEFLASALPPGVVEPVPFSAARKSELGYDLLAAVGGGRLRWYRGNDPESLEFWHEVEACQRELTGAQLMRWFVPQTSGHDDFLNALALLVSAAKAVSPPAAAAIIPARDPFEG